MNYLHSYTVRRNVMGFLLLVIILFGTYAALSDTLAVESSSIWSEISPYAGYIALGAIILYIPLSILDKRLYEKALKEHKDKE